MRTERGAVLAKHPLAVVCLLAFLIGGAAAVILNYPTRHTAAPGQVAQTPAEAGLEVEPEADAPAAPSAELGHTGEGTTSNEFDDSAAQLEEPDGEVEEDFSESAAGPENSSNGVRRRRATGEQAVQSRPAPRPYVSASRGQTNPGGMVAGYTVGGVKKTGQGVKKVGTTTGKGVKKAGTTIGRTFGKIGGVFND